MRRPTNNTTLLPKQLRQELGLNDSRKLGDKRSRQNGSLSRKEKRKTERSQKKGFRHGNGASVARRNNEESSDSEESSDGKRSKRDQLAPQNAGNRGNTQPKSILKKKEPPREVESDGDTEEDSEENIDDDDNDGDNDIDGSDIQDDDSESYDSSEPAPKPTVSRKARDKMAEDDAEIAALERKLGMKGKNKLSKSFHDDGLDEVLGDLADGSEDDSKKRKREGNEWLQQKRRKSQAENANNLLDESENGTSHGSEDSEDEDNSAFEGFEDEAPPPTPKVRENPYVAPVTPVPPKDTGAGKYVPPSRRAPPSDESETLLRLRRQTQGHLNKLSEANLVSILGDIEKLYQDYPRQSVTTTLIDLLFGLIFDKSTLQDTFIILHAGFVGAMYKVMGMDFGAEFIQRVVERFDNTYENGDKDDLPERKEMVNVISLLSHLYNFHVIGSSLIFDYIRLFLTEITELNTELLLKIIRSTLNSIILSTIFFAKCYI